MLTSANVWDLTTTALNKSFDLRLKPFHPYYRDAGPRSFQKGLSHVVGEKDVLVSLYDRWVIQNE